MLDRAPDLDSWAPGQRPPRAREADALSSHAAADRLKHTGRSGELLQATLDAVRRFPGCSSKELARAAGLERHDAARCLPILWRRHLVERVEPAEGGELAWFPAGAAPETANASKHERRRARLFAAALSWDAALSRARASFRAAGLRATDEDVRGAAGIELRLSLVYTGKLRARLLAGGRVEVGPISGGDT